MNVIPAETARYESFNAKRKVEKEKHMKACEDAYDKLDSPVEALVGPLVVGRLICVIKYHEIMKKHGISHFDTSSGDDNATTGE
eukprot:3625112-Ditylum_brightwellii.AAC.1